MLLFLTSCYNLIGAKEKRVQLLWMRRFRVGKLLRRQRYDGPHQEEEEKEEEEFKFRFYRF